MQKYLGTTIHVDEMIGVTPNLSDVSSWSPDNAAVIVELLPPCGPSRLEWVKAKDTL